MTKSPLRRSSEIAATVFLAGSFALFTVSVISSCSHAPPSPSSSMQSAPRERGLYEQGLKVLAQKDFESAAKKFSDLIAQYPTSKWLPDAYYNWGAALEGQSNYQAAEEKYKKVVEYYEGIPSREEAEALYRLSLCYEAQGLDEKNIMALLELNTRAQYLSSDVATVEVPARLAAAYAREGNEEQAQSYFAKAESGLKRIRRTARGQNDMMIWLPKTLYSMGHIPPAHKGMSADEFKNYSASLEKAQPWLVRAAELNDKTWSKKAADELLASYQEAWNAIDLVTTPAGPDKVQDLKDRQDQQRSMALDLDTAISRLKLERLPSVPGDPESEVLADTFDRLSSIEKRLNLLIQEPDVQDQPTAEAQRREGIKRRGRIIEHGR
jgi:tetratricopeptide (TPR) repeat protein